MSTESRPYKNVSEAARAREVFKYDPSLIKEILYNNSDSSLPNSGLSTSRDPVLGALAQLGSCRLKTARSLISLFDQKWQYIIAESTPTLPLRPTLRHNECDGEDLWHCGTAIPRVPGVCDYILNPPDLAEFDDAKDPTGDLPITVVNDLAADPRFNSKPYCLSGSPARFYAAVPIRSPRGINIGVYCVIHTEPKDDWNDESSRILRDISHTIMDYMDTRRLKIAHRRNERMNRGLGSFVEGKATVSSRWSNPDVTDLDDDPEREGILNQKQQSIQRTRDDEADQVWIETQQRLNTPTNSISKRRHSPRFSVQDVFTGQRAQTRSPVLEGGGRSTGMKCNEDQNSITGIFSKAANIIRESVEVEGALFLDASMGSFRPSDGRLSSNDMHGSQTQSPSSSSDEGKADSANDDTDGPYCRVLGYSTSRTSSIDGDGNSEKHVVVPETLVSTLLRRYPKGKIYNFDEHGTLQSSDSSGSDESAMSPVGTKLPNPRSKHQKKPWARHLEGRAIANIFPGARSVAFVPVWDSRKDRWFAGGFVYTCTPTRIFTTEGEMSYLRGFGTLAVSETFRLETVLADKAKADVLNSLSHELRSPLHGVLLGVELLHDTAIDVFQGDLLHTVETCGRTLLDTVDHLLDFAKVNNYIANRRQRGGRGLRPGRSDSIEAGMKSLYSDVNLALLAEEVMESVFAGFNFQYRSVAQIARHHRDADARANQRLDSMQTMEELDPHEKEKLQIVMGEVCVYLDVDPNVPWLFSTTPGAIRRVIMNLIGNSLKYTQKGTIKLALKQETSAKKSRVEQHTVHIIVADTGKGIGEDYLQNDVFKPFSQENPLAPGTGLGLSIVKQITSSLGGRVKIESRVGQGTTVTVSVPLLQVDPSSLADKELGEGDSQDERDFKSQIEKLKGLRVRLVGFEGSSNRDANDEGPRSLSEDHALTESICRGWLQMQVISESEAQLLAPDLVLCAESCLNSLDLEEKPSNRSPTVVICKNALVAYQRIASASLAERTGVFEFTSQPTGPRKLARILLLAFQRWLDQQFISPQSRESSPDPKRRSLEADSPDATSSILSTAASSMNTPGTSYFGELASASSAQDGYEVESSLPAIASDQSLYHRSPTSSSSTRKAEEVSLRPSSNVEFLLVDDNPINLKILCTYMNKLGRKFSTATNGQEAVETFQRAPGQFQCIFMDISMPVMDGFEATRQIRALERDKRLQPPAIFAISGLASTDAQQEALGSGIDLFLTKPVKLKEISSILKSRDLL